MLEIFRRKKRMNQRPLMVVRIHKENCEDSQKTNIKYESLKNRFKKDKVIFLSLNYTNSSTTHQANLFASSLKIQKVVQRYTKAGTLLLIDGPSKSLLCDLSTDMLFSEMKHIIRQHLKTD